MTTTATVPSSIPQFRALILSPTGIKAHTKWTPGAAEDAPAICRANYPSWKFVQVIDIRHVKPTQHTVRFEVRPDHLLLSVLYSDSRRLNLTVNWSGCKMSGSAQTKEVWAAFTAFLDKRMEGNNLDRMNILKGLATEHKTVEAFTAAIKAIL